MFNAFGFNTVPLNASEELKPDLSKLFPANHTELRAWAGRYPGRSDLASFVLFKLVGRMMPPKLDHAFSDWADSTQRPVGRPKSDPAIRKLICELYPEYRATQQATRKGLTLAERRAILKGDRSQMAPNFLAAQQVAEKLRQLGFPPISPAHVQKIYSSAKNNSNFSK